MSHINIFHLYGGMCIYLLLCSFPVLLSGISLCAKRYWLLLWLFARSVRSLAKANANVLGNQFDNLSVFQALLPESPFIHSFIHSFVNSFFHSFCCLPYDRPIACSKAGSQQSSNQCFFQFAVSSLFYKVIK